MLKNAKSGKLNNSFVKIFNDMIKYNIKVQNFNVSVINPILKTDDNSNNPEDFRPISVSSVISNLYERLILSKTFETFNFNKKQFGYRKFSSCKHASFLVNETL
jgi:hypothetical protein